jgi:ABC-type phosphate/phosphonate transport system substrate-binding protein
VLLLRTENKSEIDFIMKLSARYKKLTIWNRLFVLGAIAGIIVLVWMIVSNSCTASKLEKIESKIKNIPTEEEVEKVISKSANAFKEYLEEKYGAPTAFFGATDKGLIVPYGENPPGIDIDWKTASVLEATHKRIKIRIPSLTINTGEGGRLNADDTTITVPKNIGYSRALFAAEGFGIRATVIGIDKGITVIGFSAVTKP